jgi:2-methylcitrate dehydratase PrpD
MAMKVQTCDGGAGVGACAPVFEQRLADWMAGLACESLPDSAVRAARRLLLDTLAVAWAGAGAQGVRPVLDMLAAQGGAAESRLWVSGLALPAPAAALANGLCASALDFDSVHGLATVHPDIVLVPALLALAERGGCSGREFLAAYVAGSEMLVRLGMAVERHPGWFLTSALGVLACAAACARLLGLGADGIGRAMGIALSRAAGTQQPLAEGSFSKRLQSAYAARDGLEAALLAQCGADGPRHVFGGRAGFEQLYVGLDRQQALEGLGSEYRFESLTLKKYPSCFCNHAAIVAALDLVQRQGVQADAVREGVVRLSPFSARLVGGAYAPKASPQVAAQFSVRYSVASVLLRGRFALADIDPAAALDPQAVALATRIKVRVDSEQEGKFVPVSLSVLCHDGTRRECTVERIPGTPELPLSGEELREKVLDCFAHGVRPMPAAQVRQLMARMDGLEEMADLRDLWNFN